MVTGDPVLIADVAKHRPVAKATRISLGVQQLNDEVLKQNGRIHLERDVERAYAVALLRLFKE